MRVPSGDHTGSLSSKFLSLVNGSSFFVLTSKRYRCVARCRREVTLHVLLEMIAVDDDGLGQLSSALPGALLAELVGVLLVANAHFQHEPAAVRRPHVTRNVFLHAGKLAGFSSQPVEQPHLLSWHPRAARKETTDISRPDSSAENCRPPARWSTARCAFPPNSPSRWRSSACPLRDPRW